MATLEERVQALEKLLSAAAGAEPYNSQHTGPQIDDAIARALPGGAIDTALQNKVNNDRPTMLSFPLLDGYSAPYHCAYYRNALGDVTLELCFSGPITTSWKDVGILPEGYRPTSVIYAPAGASPGGGNGFFAIGVYIGANGYVKVRSPNDYSDVEITINLSFLAL